MAAMSEQPPDARPDDTLWVVDVTAPLPPGRVRLVAAEAAARLHLPAEKLVALLENRIGPVTKPLPKASADRVAEVLDLAGADVAIRSAEARDASDGDSASAPSAAAAPRGEAADAPAAAATERERPVRSGASGPSPDAAREPGSREGTPSDPLADDAAPAEVPLGRAGREAVGRGPRRDREAPDAARGGGAPVAGAAAAGPPEAGEAWPDDLTERAEDDAMLGAWRRRAPAAPLAAEPPPEEDRAGPSEALTAGGHGPPGAAPGGSGGAVPASVEAEGAWDVDDEDEDDEDAWAFGLRDPFAEAERRERAVRRWALGLALLVAVAVFLALQWAYSVPGPEGRTPPAYEAGLRHYRDGAFVSAARAWTPRAEAGDAQAMYMLGWMAEFGQGRPWSNQEAAGWYRQAADRGHVAAATRLAGLYGRGLGVARDDGEALRWYLRAAEGGDAAAQREAARRLAAAGRLAEARSWLRRAARADPDAAAWHALLDAAE
jgi:hypothetical protein